MGRNEKMSRVTWNRTAAFNSSLLPFLSHFKERTRSSRIKSSSGKQAKSCESHKNVRGLRALRSLHLPEEPHLGLLPTSCPQVRVGSARCCWFWSQLCCSRAGLHLCLQLVLGLPTVGSPSAERNLWTCALTLSPALSAFAPAWSPLMAPVPGSPLALSGTANGPHYQHQLWWCVQLLWVCAVGEAMGLSSPEVWPSWVSQPPFLNSQPDTDCSL